MVGRKLCFLVFMVTLSHAPQLSLAGVQKLASDAIGDDKMSPTISIQKVYNFVNGAPTEIPTEAAGTTQNFRDGEQVVFDEDGDDDTDSVTTPSSTSIPSVEGEDNDAEGSPTGSPADGAPSETDLDPADSPVDTDALEPSEGTSSVDGGKPPAEAVPGQPEDVADADSSSSSSSSSESRSASSSSSSEEEYKDVLKKAWDHKLKNELNVAKSKDRLARIYSPLSNRGKVLKKLSKQFQ